VFIVIFVLYLLAYIVFYWLLNLKKNYMLLIICLINVLIILLIRNWAHALVIYM
jgi:hypothetical protein